MVAREGMLAEQVALPRDKILDTPKGIGEKKMQIVFFRKSSSTKK